MADLPLIYQHPALQAWFWSSFGVWMCLEFWVWLRERGGTVGENRDRGSKIWVIASVWIGMYAAFGLMYNAPRGEIGHGALLWFGIGIALIFLGVALRWWAIRTLGRFFRTSVIIQGEHRMVTSGPYRRVR
ncbi:MAG: isoprenylcysteine carboxylmethyltransferase family protein, partial [Streptosporangiaceae bacterium]